MHSCGDLKEKDILFCSECGIELEVKHTCDCPSEKCEPMSKKDVCCEFECCGKSMQIK